MYIELFHLVKTYTEDVDGSYPELNSEQDHFDLAAATQYIYERILKAVMEHTQQVCKSRNLVIMGGCALNCSANSNITDRWKNVWIMPNQRCGLLYWCDTEVL